MHKINKLQSWASQSAILCNCKSAILSRSTDVDLSYDMAVRMSFALHPLSMISKHSTIPVPGSQPVYTSGKK